MLPEPEYIIVRAYTSPPCLIEVTGHNPRAKRITGRDVLRQGAPVTVKASDVLARHASFKAATKGLYAVRQAIREQDLALARARREYVRTQQERDRILKAAAEGRKLPGHLP